MATQYINSSGKIVGDLAVRHLDVEKNHDCVEWKIGNYSSLLDKNETIQSPKFTIGTADKCKWHFSFLSFRGNVQNSKSVTSICYLVLNHESDCKKAFVDVKFTFATGNAGNPHSCRNRLNSGRTCELISKSEDENRVGIYSQLDPKLIQENILRVECEIAIQKVIPETDGLSKNLESLLNNQLFTDIVLSIDGKKFPAHKAILAARSPVFAAMLTHDMVEKKGTICIADIDEPVVEEMLHYVYTGILTPKSKHFAKNLLVAADKYDMKELQTECEEILIEHLSSSNALDVLAFAKLIDRKEMKSKIIDFILVNKIKIMDTEGWKSLHQSDPELLQEICEACFRSKN